MRVNNVHQISLLCKSSITSEELLFNQVTQARIWCKIYAPWPFLYYVMWPHFSWEATRISCPILHLIICKETGLNDDTTQCCILSKSGGETRLDDITQRCTLSLSGGETGLNDTTQRYILSFSKGETGLDDTTQRCILSFSRGETGLDDATQRCILSLSGGETRLDDTTQRCILS